MARTAFRAWLSGAKLFSLHTNRRDDHYGGDVAGSSRFLAETLSAVRAVWPESLPLTARFGVIEYDGNDEQVLQESIQMTKALRSDGLDLLNVSVGFWTPDANIPWEEAFLASIAHRVRHETGLPVASSWGINRPQIAERAVASRQIGLVMVGRAQLADPHYPYSAALQLKVEQPSWVLAVPYAHWLARYKMHHGIEEN